MSVGLVGAIGADERSVHSVSMMTGEVEGVLDVPLSLPRVLGRGGVLGDLTPELDDGERTALKASAIMLKEILESVSLTFP